MAGGMISAAAGGLGSAKSGQALGMGSSSLHYIWQDLHSECYIGPQWSTQGNSANDAAGGPHHLSPHQTPPLKEHWTGYI